MLGTITIKHRIIILLLSLSIIQSSIAFDALSAPVAVVYPDMAEPYQSVFADIINGIDESLSNPLLRYVLQKDEENILSSWLKEKNCSVVIALGKQGLNATAKLLPEHEVIAGAVLSPPANLDRKWIGITLSPSPDKLFQRLRQLSPEVKRINMIYSEKYSAWLVPFAEQAAKKNKLTLNALKANSLAEAATFYRDLIANNISREDAIWLPHDNVTVDHRTILPMILKEAWNKQFIVFSSNPAYVKRGVLFALFPDNVQMGTSIAGVVKKVLSKKSSSINGMLPLEGLKIAVNVRTADHLGLNISSSDRRSFHLVFPAPR